MQPKTFGKRGAPKPQINSTARPQTPHPTNPSTMRFPHEPAPVGSSARSATPSHLSGLYIADNEPKEERSPRISAKNGHLNLISLAITVALVAIGLSMCQPSDADRQRTAKLAAERRERGFHCLLGWDGSHVGFVKSVKNYMRDPNSFEHIKTVVTPVKDGKHTIIMDYRGRNGFGGMNAEVAVGVVSNSSCGLLEWSRP